MNRMRFCALRYRLSGYHRPVSCEVCGNGPCRLGRGQGGDLAAAVQARGLLPRTRATVAVLRSHLMAWMRGRR